MYALPNPPDVHHPQFDKTSLVPLLLGMDHLAKDPSAVVIDFSTGLAMDAHDPHPEPYQLRTTKKGHDVLDLVHYLTRGCGNDQGHPEIRVLHQAPPEVETIHQLEFHAVEYYDMTVDHIVPDEIRVVRSCERLRTLHAASVALRNGQPFHDSTAASCSMSGGNSTPYNSRTPQFGADGSAFDSNREDRRSRGGDWPHQEEYSEPQSGPTLGSEPQEWDRPSRPPCTSGHIPTADICRAMFKKIEAEEALHSSIEAVIGQSSTKISKGYPTKKVSRPQPQAQPSVSSTPTSWDAVGQEVEEESQ